VWTPVLTDLVVTDQFGNTSVHKANPVTKRFTYLNFTENVNALLAEWDSSGDALWYVRLSVFDGGGTPQGTDTHLIQLDNTVPEASITITTGPGNRGKFPIGTVLSGTFVARDLNLGSFALGVAPGVNRPGVGVPSPSSGLGNTARHPETPGRSTPLEWIRADASSRSWPRIAPSSTASRWGITARTAPASVSTGQNITSSRQGCR
jgi:hypothetical protein